MSYSARTWSATDWRLDYWASDFTYCSLSLQLAHKLFLAGYLYTSLSLSHHKSRTLCSSRYASYKYTLSLLHIHCISLGMSLTKIHSLYHTFKHSISLSITYTSFFSNSLTYKLYFFLSLLYLPLSFLHKSQIRYFSMSITHVHSLSIYTLTALSVSCTYSILFY